MDDSDIAKYTNQVFKMFRGPVTDVTIEIDDSLIDIVQDKFGGRAIIVRTSPKKCVASVQLQVSSTF